MADQLKSTFRTAILEEERQKAQQRGETILRVGAMSPSVTIGLVEKLTHVLCVQSALFQHLDTWHLSLITRINPGAPLLAPGRLCPNVQDGD